MLLTNPSDVVVKVGSESTLLLTACQIAFL
nr:MAG TPA: hypothetical protein [Bacteriophage sp.]